MTEVSMKRSLGIGLHKCNFIFIDSHQRAGEALKILLVKLISEWTKGAHSVVCKQAKNVKHST